ncbi:MAG: class I SAM-dependent methyltransferase [Burkholderiaceae bacterium]|nr:class I SAM-dependent methyltransferase [Burkholderiaceae bacterium]
MSDWTEGYSSDIGYTSNFYSELTPRWLVTSAHLMGQHAPDIERPYTYCELGCGQGFGTALMAAANPLGRFWAIDFNPGQIANAQRMAVDAALDNIEFIEDSFQNLADSPTDLCPKFDFMVMHGIYSWVSRENQLALCRILLRYLKPGGMVYISYNCQPGWAQFQAAKKLIKLHAQAHPGRSDKQAVAGLQYLAAVRDAGAKAFTSYPDLPKVVDTLSKQDHSYLSHELLHEHWHIHHSSDVARDMASAKLEFIGSAHLVDNLKQVSLPAKMIPLVEAAADSMIAETLKDLARNQNFRRDIFIRGAVAMGPIEQAGALKRLSFALLREPPPAGEIKFATPLGEAVGKDAVYRPLLEAMQKGPLSLEEAMSLPAWKDVPRAELIQAFTLLMAGSFIHPVPHGAKGEALRNADGEGASARRFNRMVQERGLQGLDYSFLAAPVSGGGVIAQFIDMMILMTLQSQPKLKGVALADAVLTLMESHGRELLKEGKPFASRDEKVAEVMARLDVMNAGKFKAWRDLGVMA